MNFGTTAETNYDGINIPNLEPGKYENVKLTSVKFEKTTKKDGTNGKDIITFLFTTPDGRSHQHTEYDIDPTDAKAGDKVTNMTKRVGHIMSKFVPKERLAQNSATFAQYGAWVVATLQAAGYQNVPVDILIVGNVYNNKATSGFSGYPPFIARHGEALQFDNNGIRANNQWKAFQEKNTNPTPDADGGSSAPQGGGMYSTGPVQSDF